MTKRLRDLPQRLARALLVGILAGLATLLLDAFLAWLTLGYTIPIRLHFVAWYAAAGAVVAVLFRCGAWRAGVDLFAVTVASLYAPAIAERVSTILASRLGGALAVVGASAAVAGYGLWLALTVRLAGRAHGLLIGALAVALGLALNRNVIALPTEARALLADIAVLAAAVGLGVAARKLGARRVAVAVGAAAAIVAALRAAPDVISAAARPDPPPAVSRTNVLLVIVDTLRADVFRAVADETEEGRAFRQALGNAVWFSNAVAAAPWTPPSMGSILTGLYPQEHGFTRIRGGDPGRPLRRLDESVTTLAEHLRDRGYLTAAITTNPFLHRESGILQGFERFETLQDGTAKLPLLTAFQRLGLLDTELYQGAERVRRRFARQLGRLARRARPFFFWLHLMDPHQPLRAHPDLSPDPAAAELSRLDRRYRDEVRYALRELARMFELVQRRGLWEKTTVVLVSDHGEMLVSDRRFRQARRQGRGFRRQGHGHVLFRELVRVPLVIRLAGGGLAADREVDALVGHVDLVHTVTDVLGVDRMEIPAGRTTLEPWLRPEPPAHGSPGRSHVLVGATHFRAPEQRGVRTAKHKLIEYPNGERPVELYDLVRDAGERRNVASRQPRHLARLTRLLEDSWSELLPPPAAEALEIDEESRKRLEALGYL